MLCTCFLANLVRAKGGSVDEGSKSGKTDAEAKSDTASKPGRCRVGYRVASGIPGRWNVNQPMVMLPSAA